MTIIDHRPCNILVLLLYLLLDLLFVKTLTYILGKIKIAAMYESFLIVPVMLFRN